MAITGFCSDGTVPVKKSVGNKEGSTIAISVYKVQVWLTELQHYAPGVLVLLVGRKLDLSKGKHYLSDHRGSDPVTTAEWLTELQHYAPGVLVLLILPEDKHYLSEHPGSVHNNCIRIWPVLTDGSANRQSHQLPKHKRNSRGLSCTRILCKIFAKDIGTARLSSTPIAMVTTSLVKLVTTSSIATTKFAYQLFLYTSLVKLVTTSSIATTKFAYQLFLYT
ncbi:hypothetical protein SUGI_0803670 [Cryptomeria japonica]|nr:hypothetical protein SUGI_0803670 [Cryptomeria japonica]